jgi:CubicO group peptidase (beta-lactamase class C family)
MAGNSSATDFLAEIERRYEGCTLRAAVMSSEGQILLTQGDPTLPLALSGATKLFTLAMVLREIDRGALALDTTLGDLLPSDTVAGLAVWRGKDHSFEVTIKDLLSHRSGIVDYMAPPSKVARSLATQFLEQDRGWSLEQALEIARHYPALSAPGASSSSHYSSTNYLLLGAILQLTTGMSFSGLIQLRVVSSLKLPGTYVFGPDFYDRYFSLAPIHNGNQVVRIPQALASSGADGSIVSTAQDTLNLIRAFQGGEIFDSSWLPQLAQDVSPGREFPPLGLGVMVRPRSYRKPLVLGHSGQTGVAVAWAPDQGTMAFLATQRWQTHKSAFSAAVGLLDTWTEHRD